MVWDSRLCSSARRDEPLAKLQLCITGRFPSEVFRGPRSCKPRAISVSYDGLLVWMFLSEYCHLCFNVAHLIFRESYWQARAAGGSPPKNNSRVARASCVQRLGSGSYIISKAQEPTLLIYRKRLFSSKATSLLVVWLTKWLMMDLSKSTKGYSIVSLIVSVLLVPGWSLSSLLCTAFTSFFSRWSAAQLCPSKIAATTRFSP